MIEYETYLLFTERKYPLTKWKCPVSLLYSSKRYIFSQMKLGLEASKSELESHPSFTAFENVGKFTLTENWEYYYICYKGSRRLCKWSHDHFLSFLTVLSPVSFTPGLKMFSSIYFTLYSNFPLSTSSHFA